MTYSPLFTNAYLNRAYAIQCLLMGMKAPEIAYLWGQVWMLKHDSRLAQRYNYTLNDGSGRREINTTMALVPKAIGLWMEGFTIIQIDRALETT